MNPGYPNRHSMVTPELLRLYSKADSSSLRGYSGSTPELLRLYSNVGLTSLQGYSGVTPGLLRHYSQAAQAQLCGHSCPTPALLLSLFLLLLLVTLKLPRVLTPSLLRTQFLLTSYSGVTHGQGEAFNPLLL